MFKGVIASKIKPIIKRTKQLLSNFLKEGKKIKGQIIGGLTTSPSVTMVTTKIDKSK